MENNKTDSLYNEAIKKSKLPVPQTWDKYTNRRIKTLHPLMRWYFATAINNCEKNHGVFVRLTDAFRSFDIQDRKFGEGRTREECISHGVNPSYAKPRFAWKTNAVGGKSFHNYGLAGDVCEIRKKQALWATANWKIIAEEFKKLGFQWLFDIMGKDKPHFQMPFGFKINELIALHQNNKYKNGFLILK